MIRLQLEVTAYSWRGVRVALRQMYNRDIPDVGGVLTPGPNGNYAYEVKVLQIEEPGHTTTQGE